MRRKKYALIASVIAIIMVLSGCGSGNSEPEETTLPVKVAVETLQTTTTVTTAPPVVVEELTDYEKTDAALSEIPNNIDDTIDLSLVCVNGNWLSIRSMPLENFISGGGIKKCSWSTISNPDTSLYFVGNGYGIDASEQENPDMNYGYNVNKYTLTDPTSFNGTLLGIECSLNGVPMETVEEEKFKEYRIKAVTTSSDNTKDDYEVSYYGGVKVGMTREQVKELLGDKGIIKNEVTIATTTTTTTTTTTEVTTTPLPTDTSETISSVEGETSIPAEGAETSAPVAETNEAGETVTAAVTTVAETSAETSAEETTTKKKKKKKNTETEEETTTTSETTTVTTTLPEGVYVVTDENGLEVTEAVTDELGNIVTNELSEIVTQVVTETEPPVTTVPVLDEFESNYYGYMYFKNTNNTMVIIFEKGIASKIFLYNNITIQ